MKSLLALIGFAIAILMAGCQGAETSPSATAPVTLTLTHQTTPTRIPPSATTRRTPTEPNTPRVAGTSTPTASATIPPAARLTFQCLEVASTLPSKITTNGTVVLESRVVVNGRNKSESYLLNITTGRIITIEHGGEFIISLDRTLMAYRHVALDDQDRIVKNDLIIADVSGQTLKVIPWEKEWSVMLGWLDGQRLIIRTSELYSESQISFGLLVWNPFSGERQVVLSVFPKFVTNLPRTQAFQSWGGGWFNVMYDPTLTRAIYPRYVGEDDEYLTYAIWAVSKQQLVATLENIFVVPSSDNGIYPKPQWSPDGSQFVFRGLAPVSDQLVEFELYRVSRDGQVEQLTHLTSIVLVQDSNLSWSPDGRHIAMFLNRLDPFERQARVAVLDTTTLDITNYCIPITYQGEGYGLEPPLPIWSPDGTQFLIVDWYEKDHQRVILVDIVQKIAAQIADDMEPVGWMNSNP